MLTPSKFVLPNGIRVVLTPMHGTEAAAIIIMAKAGSRCEDKATNGLAHFLEHMFFKGGVRYPTTQAVAEAADNLGAEYNAGTSEQEVEYYIQCAGSQLPKAMDILSDMLLESKFEPEEIEKERGVVLEEINRKLDAPGSLIWDDWQSLIYGDQPLGRSTLGPPENIKRFSQEDFLAYREKFYANTNLVISIAGNYGDKVRQTIEKYFGRKPLVIGNSWPMFAPHTDAKRVNLRTEDTNQAHFIVGGAAYSERHAKTRATRLLSIILGGGMSSRLFLTIREQQGLCYSVGTNYERMADTGFFAAYAGVTLDKIQQAIAGILKEFKKIREKGIIKKELRKAKNMLEGAFALQLENSMSVATFFGRQELLFENMRTPQHVLSEIQAVTVEEVNAVARELLDPSAFRLAIIGPYENPEEFQKLLGS